MITTRNRCEELRRTLRVVNNLDPAPNEIMVTADGCNDETVEMLHRDFSDVRLTINAQGQGSVASRDAMMRSTEAEFVLALDDDSYPEQGDCLTTLLEYFTANPRVAVATFPQRSDEYPASLRQNSFGVERPIRWFPNSGACLRTETYRVLSGFEPAFFHMYEEVDYALQCIANGWDVRLLPQITIRHHFTRNQRSELTNHQRHARNESWSTVMRCPAALLPPMLAYRILSQACFAWRYGGAAWLVQEPAWWGQALRGLFSAVKRRRPVNIGGYVRWLRTPA